MFLSEAPDKNEILHKVYLILFLTYKNKFQRKYTIKHAFSMAIIYLNHGRFDHGGYL